MTPVEASGALGGKGQPVHTKRIAPKLISRRPDIRIWAQVYPINSKTGQKVPFTSVNYAAALFFTAMHPATKPFSFMALRNLAILGQQFRFWLCGIWHLV